MKIESIRLKNFKSFQDTELSNLPNFCVIVGANGTGKSTIFQIFGFLRDAMTTNVHTALAKLGGSRGIKEVRSRDSQGPIEIELKFRAKAKGMVIPSVVKIFNERNINIEEVHSRSKSHKKDETMEMDIIGDNSAYVVAIEVKSKLLSYDVLHFVEKLGRFKYFFPKYAGKDLVGAVAGITVDDSVKKLAINNKLFVIMQKGENVEIINDAGFKPEVW
jgi:predicted ATP-binding protein involved in virulence